MRTSNLNLLDEHLSSHRWLNQQVTDQPFGARISSKNISKQEFSCHVTLCDYITTSTFFKSHFFINVYMGVFLFNTVIKVFSLLCLCILIVCLCIFTSTTWTEVFPCFFLTSKTKARAKPAKTGHGTHSSKIIVLFFVLFVLCRSVYSVCKCVLYYCHRVATPNCRISYHIILRLSIKLFIMWIVRNIYYLLIYSMQQSPS